LATGRGGGEESTPPSPKVVPAFMEETSILEDDSIEVGRGAHSSPVSTLTLDFSLPTCPAD